MILPMPESRWRRRYSLLSPRWPDGRPSPRPARAKMADERIGQRLSDGVPNFRMEKWHIDRRVEQLAPEGGTVRTCGSVGVERHADELRGALNAIVLFSGAIHPRDLAVRGHGLGSIYF